MDDRQPLCFGEPPPRKIPFSEALILIVKGYWKRTKRRLFDSYEQQLYRAIKEEISFERDYIDRYVRLKDKAAGWIELKRLYGNKCAACHVPEKKQRMTRDHKIPITLGGGNDLDNFQPLCASCNSSKGGKVWFARCRLDRKPPKPLFW